MDPERLTKLRGMMQRGELGCGPVTEALVRELLQDRDALAEQLHTCDAVKPTTAKQPPAPNPTHPRQYSDR